MKYFTPERLVRLQDHSDERQFLAALDDWEQALKEYREQLEGIRKRLLAMPPRPPENLLRFLDLLNRTSFHDARVEMAWGGKSRCRIDLRLDYQPERLLTLTYSLEEPPHIMPNVLPEQLCSELATWLYDEVSFGGQANSGKLLLHHAILLGDGSEVHLRFYHIRFDFFTPLLPAVPANGACA